MDNIDNSLGSQFLENVEINIQDEMPVPKEEIVDIKADDSDLDIIEVHCSINPNRMNTVKKHMQSKVRGKIQRKNVDCAAKIQPKLDVTEEIVISDSSDTESYSSAKKPTKHTYSTRRNQENSLSSIILNCPRCNRTKTVFSTTLTSLCKECKVNMTFVCNECTQKYDSLLALFRHKKIQCKKRLSPSTQFVHKCIKCQVKYKISNFSKHRNCLKCKLPMAYECAICSREHTSHAVIYKHVRHQCQPNSQLFFCNDCQYKASSQRSLILHLSSSHQNLYMFNTSCDKCGKGFTNHLTLKQHKVICGTPYYYCKLCPYRPRHWLSLRRHLLVVHKIPTNEVDKIIETSICPHSYSKVTTGDNIANVMNNFKLLEDEIEVEEKPALITQDRPTPCAQSPKQSESRKIENIAFVNVAGSSGNERAGTSESSVSNDSDSRDLQTAILVSKAGGFFNSENNNDLVSTTHSKTKMDEVLDPLQSRCDVDTIETVRDDEQTSDIEIISSSNNKKNFIFSKSGIKIFMPYIRKLCRNCEKVTELAVDDSGTNERCNSCKKPVTYCCKLCLEVKSLKEMYVHVFKYHYNDAKSSGTTMKIHASKGFICDKCGSQYSTSSKLADHQLLCNVMPNLFCKFCPSMMRLKREMREHMIEKHSQLFKMDSLEKMLNEIVVEGDSVINMLTILDGYCNTCKKAVPLTNRPILCITCSGKLIYHCKDPECSSIVFTQLSSLQRHLQYHANKGWSTRTTRYDINKIACHFCDYKGDRVHLNMHMSTEHFEIFLCKCDLCGASLKNVKAWKRHQANYCPAKHQKLQCEHCWFRSFKKKRLRRHLKTVHTHLYTGKRSFCKKCGITWAGLYRLRWHASRCSGDFKVERAKQKELWAMRGVVTLS